MHIHLRKASLDDDEEEKSLPSFMVFRQSLDLGLDDERDTDEESAIGTVST